MLHAEYLTGNPFTGRQVWFIRHIPSGEFGDPWDWGVIVMRPGYLTRYCELWGGSGDIDMGKAREIVKLLRLMGFKRARAHRKGRWKEYRIS